MELKKKILALIGVFVLESTNTQAEGFIGIQTGFPLLFGVQIGSYLAPDQPGFAIRAALRGTLLPGLSAVDLSTDGFYRIPLASNGSSFYFGAGAGLLTVIGPAVATSSPGSPDATVVPHIHSMLGFEVGIGEQTKFFLETYPLAIVFIGPPALTPLGLSAGLNFRF